MPYYNRYEDYFSEGKTYAKGNFQPLWIQPSNLQKQCAHLGIQNHFHPTLLDHPREANIKFTEEVDGILTLQENIEGLIKEKRDAEMERGEAWEEIKRLQDENKYLRKYAACDDGASAEVTFLEKLRSGTKQHDALKFAADAEKQEVESLKATIDMKNEIVKLLKTKAEEDNEWIEEISQDRDEWTNRAERLEGEVNNLRQLANDLQQGKVLDAHNDEPYILAQEMTTMLRDLNEIENFRQLNEAVEKEKFEEGVLQGFEEAVKKQVEKIMADHDEVKKLVERVKRNASMSDATRLCLDAQQEINRRLSDQLVEEQNIVLERNIEISLLRKMHRDMEDQAINMKKEIARLKRGEVLGVQKVSSSLEESKASPPTRN